LVNNDSLIEEHIIGVPGDQFVNSYIKKNENFKALRLAKEFVKFNERCFVRLLGDMRAYNYVVVMKQDFDKVQYRIRAMDFDQQSFEGRKSIYLPQYYKDNLYYVEMAQKEISIETAEQYKKEERALLAKRVLLAKSKFIELMSAMSNDTISTEENIRELAKGLNRHHKTSSFTGLSSMAELLLLNVNLCLDLNLKV
jgi:hypothetical protein